MSISDQLRNELFTCMHTLAHTYHHQNHNALSTIHNGQGKLLHILLQIDGCNQQELAAYMHIRPASLSELIQKAEAKGLIRRQPNAHDKRKNDVFLTEAGRLQAQKDLSGATDSAADIFSVLTEDEQRQLLALLRKLDEHLTTVFDIPAPFEVPTPFQRFDHRRSRRGRSDD